MGRKYKIFIFHVELEIFKNPGISQRIDPNPRKSRDSEILRFGIFWDKEQDPGIRDTGKILSHRHLWPKLLWRYKKIKKFKLIRAQKKGVKL